MKSILRPTGSIYLHCDPTASHYIKIMMDGIFGHENFQNEIIWKRTSAHSGAKRYGPIHDVILFYTASASFTWNAVYGPYDQKYIDAFFTHKDNSGRRWRRTDLTGRGTRKGNSGLPWRGFDPTERGRHWQPPSYFYEKYQALTGSDLAQYPLIERLDHLDEIGLIHWPAKTDGVPQGKRLLEDAKGIPLQDVWTDITPIHSISSERLGYPTQKPIALLDRILQASTNKGDVIFDPFCGCGTTIYSAVRNERKWIGCDIAILSIKLIREILTGDEYRLVEGRNFEVNGIPVSSEQAEELFKRDPFQFEHWIVERVGGFPTKKTGDKEIDGRMYFETKEGLKCMVLSVKGGKLRPTDVRDLRGTLVDMADTEMAGFLSLQEPSKAMLEAGSLAGQIRVWRN